MATSTSRSLAAVVLADASGQEGSIGANLLKGGIRVALVAGCALWMAYHAVSGLISTQIVGIAHAFDLLKSRGRAGLLGEIARPPTYVPESQPAVDLLVELQRKRQSMAVVFSLFTETSAFNSSGTRPMRQRVRAG